MNGADMGMESLSSKPMGQGLVGTPGPMAPKMPPQVAMAIEDLSKYNEILSNALQHLADKLSPILRASSPKESRNTNSQHPEIVPIAMLIKGNANQLMANHDFVNA